MVILSLGSNLGDSRVVVSRAMDLIAARLLSNSVRSSLYVTEPVGYVDQPPFINSAICGTSNLNAHEIVDVCNAIELELGRTRGERWREREIDIDVILVGDVVIDDEDLHVPHMSMADRRFVLVPCAEIAPDVVCPRTGLTIARLLENCPDTADVVADVHKERYANS